MRGRTVARFVVALCCAGGCHSGRSPALPAAVTTRATQPGPASSARGTLDVDDQDSDGLRIVVTKVSIEQSPNGGWITVHVDDNGKPGAVAGSVHVGPGESRRVVAPFTSKQRSARFWVVLHVDAGRSNVYEPRVDVPVLSGEDVVMQRITVDVR